MHVLVRADESHELWQLDDLDGTGKVDIEMSPCLLKVGIEIAGEGTSTESLVGSEDLTGGSLGLILIKPELTCWLSSNLGSIIKFLDLGLLLE